MTPRVGYWMGISRGFLGKKVLELYIYSNPKKRWYNEDVIVVG